VLRSQTTIGKYGLLHLSLRGRTVVADAISLRHNAGVLRKKRALIVSQINDGVRANPTK
jgi:hypothetical protein